MPYQDGYVHEPNRSFHQPARQTPYRDYAELNSRLREVFGTSRLFYSWLTGPDVDLDNFFSYVAEAHMVAEMMSRPLPLTMLNRFARCYVERKGNVVVEKGGSHEAVYYRSRINYMILLPPWVQEFVLEPVPFKDVREIARSFGLGAGCVAISSGVDARPYRTTGQP